MPIKLSPTDVSRGVMFGTLAYAAYRANILRREANLVTPRRELSILQLHNQSGFLSGGIGVVIRILYQFQDKMGGF